jgi:hypothetical protein
VSARAVCGSPSRDHDLDDEAYYYGAPIDHDLDDTPPDYGAPIDEEGEIAKEEAGRNSKCRCGRDRAGSARKVKGVCRQEFDSRCNDLAEKIRRSASAPSDCPTCLLPKKTTRGVHDDGTVGCFKTNSRACLQRSQKQKQNVPPDLDGGEPKEQRHPEDSSFGCMPLSEASQRILGVSSDPGPASVPPGVKSKVATQSILSQALSSADAIDESDFVAIGSLRCRPTVPPLPLKPVPLI